MMTDTTDIAALREKFESVFDGNKERNKYHPDVYDAYPTRAAWKYYQMGNELHLSQLEAERQRADANAQEIRRLEFQWEHRAPTQWAYDQACTALHAQRERAEVAEKERDTLKFAHGNMVTRCALLRQRTDLPVDRIPAYNALVKSQGEIAELREKLANPVVLPAGYSARAGHPFHEGERNVMIPNKHGDWLSRFDVEHAIQVAGFPFTVEGE